DSPGSGQQRRFAPLVRELVPMPDSEAVFARLAVRPHCLFLDSARRDHQLGRYSYIAVDPFDYLEVSAQDRHGFDLLEERMAAFDASLTTSHCEDLPPFQGGIAGLFGYDLAYSLERLPQVRHDEFQVPALAVGFYDAVVAFDNEQNRAWIISQGLPHQDHAARQQRAEERLLQLESWIYDEPDVAARVDEVADHQRLAIDSGAACFDVPGPPGLVSNFSADGYC
ncbi:MAG: hypothetical protein GY917_27020, partial [Planctomycetaceae bacterium]|nr:hypothetical protein [Planctomycetaceae bacterium]